MAGRWFRFYDDTLNERKVQSLPDSAFRAWVNLLCVASRCEGCIPGEMAEIAFYLRLKESKARDIIQILQSAGLLDRTEDGWEPHNWRERQYVSDTSLERVKRHREKRKAAGLVALWQAPKELRLKIYHRDNFECVYCGSTDNLTLDHKTPEMRGGTNDEDNLATACRACNGAKRDLTYDEFIARNGDRNATVTLQKRHQSTEDREETEDCSLRSQSTAAAPPVVPKPRFVLPDWVPKEAWDAFVAMRGRRFTAAARKLNLEKLSALRDAGEDPQAVLKQTVERGWSGLFPVKPETSNGSGHKPTAHENFQRGTVIALEHLKRQRQ